MAPAMLNRFVLGCPGLSRLANTSGETAQMWCVEGQRLCIWSIWSHTFMLDEGKHTEVGGLLSNIHLFCFRC